MDFRKEWFKKCIRIYFSENEEQLLDNFLYQDDSRIGMNFTLFLNDAIEVDDIRKQVFIVYRTYHTRMVEEDVEIIEEVVNQRSSSIFGQDEKKKDRKSRKKKRGKKPLRIDENEEDEEQDAFLDEEADFDHNNDRKSKKKQGVKEGRNSPFTMMENLPPEVCRGKKDVSYVSVKKKVQKLVHIPQLQGYFGVLDGDQQDQDDDTFYIYFIRKSCQPVPTVDSIDEANKKLPLYFIIGGITGDLLQNLDILLNSIYIPLFLNQIANRDEELEDAEDTAILDRRSSYYFIRRHIEDYQIPENELSLLVSSTVSSQLINFIQPDEKRKWSRLLDELMKLSNFVKWAQDELKSERKFPIPEFFCNSDWEHIEINAKTIIDIKNIMEIWIEKLNSCQALSFNELKILNLLDECVYWQRIESILGSAVDELQGPMVDKMLEIVRTDCVSIYEKFIINRKMLCQRLNGIKETVDVLNTLKYFFKVLTYGDFVKITKILPMLMGTLQSIWILSTFYSHEINMERLLINVKSTLCMRVKSSFDVTTMFKTQIKSIEDKLENAIIMLETWKWSYLRVRERIESTRDYLIARWEFSKSKLFSETDYIASIMRELKNIFRVLGHYRNLFNSKFNKITDRGYFENVTIKINNLSKPIEQVDFDIYKGIFRDEWQELLDGFDNNIIEIDQGLKFLIIKIFPQLKSVNEGIQIVNDVSKIETRPTVLDSIPYICNKIIAYFAKEIKITEQIFEKNKLNGRPYQIHESICWARELVRNLCHTFEKLKNIAVLSTTSLFNEISSHFDSFNETVENYVQNIFQDWCKKSVILVKEALKENIIGVEEEEKSLDLKKMKENKRSLKARVLDFSDVNQDSQENGDFGFGTLAFTLKWIAKSKINVENYLQKQEADTLKQIEQAHKVSWLEFVGNAILIEKGFKFKIQIKNEIFAVLKNAEALRKDGFKLPAQINELLMRKSDLLQKIETVKEIVSKYRILVTEIIPAKVLLMKRYFLETESTIQPGLTLYTWQCTGLDSYCAKVNRKLQYLICLLYQMGEIFKKLDDFTIEIENLDFCPVENRELNNKNCQEFFNILDNGQSKTMEKCLETYEKISSSLIKLESLILTTNTGKSSLMVYFYQEYESKILDALKKAVLTSITNLEKLFKGEYPIYFYIRSYLQNGEIKWSPSCNQIIKYAQTAINRIFSRLKWLKQWDRDSCIAGKNNEKIFHKKLIENEEIRDTNELVSKELQNLCDSLLESAMYWMEYSHLWTEDKTISTNEFSSRKPELSNYEKKFDFYSNICNQIEQEKSIVDVYCVRILVGDLREQLKYHCIEWKNKLGIRLAADTQNIVSEIKQIIEELNLKLDRNFQNEHDLTTILSGVIEMESISIDIEIKLYKIEEHYHELQMQKLDVCKESIDDFNRLKVSWLGTHDLCLYKKLSLDSARIAARKTIQNHIDQFGHDFREFGDEYWTKTTHLDDLDFDSRVELIAQLSKRFSSLIDQKRKLEIMHECYEITTTGDESFWKISTNLDSLKLKYSI